MVEVKQAVMDRSTGVREQTIYLLKARVIKLVPEEHGDKKSVSIHMDTGETIDTYEDIETLLAKFE